MFNFDAILRPVMEFNGKFSGVPCPCICIVIRQFKLYVFHDVLLDGRFIYDTVVITRPVITD